MFNENTFQLSYVTILTVMAENTIFKGGYTYSGIGYSVVQNVEESEKEKQKGIEKKKIIQSDTYKPSENHFTTVW